MRILSVAVLVPVLMSAPAVAATGNGHVTANTLINHKGFKIGCTSALLIPRSPIADRNMDLVFGSLDKGSATPSADADLKARLAGTRTSDCATYRAKGGYLFANVPTGEYYVVLRFVRKESTSQTTMADFEGLMMRRTLVASGTTARLRFN
jgi:hypothetical protein